MSVKRGSVFPAVYEFMKTKPNEPLTIDEVFKGAATAANEITAGQVGDCLSNAARRGDSGIVRVRHRTYSYNPKADGITDDVTESFKVGDVMEVIGLGRDDTPIVRSQSGHLYKIVEVKL